MAELDAGIGFFFGGRRQCGGGIARARVALIGSQQGGSPAHGRRRAQKPNPGKGPHTQLPSLDSSKSTKKTEVQQARRLRPCRYPWGRHPHGQRLASPRSRGARRTGRPLHGHRPVADRPLVRAPQPATADIVQRKATPATIRTGTAVTFSHPWTSCVAARSSVACGVHLIQTGPSVSRAITASRSWQPWDVHCMSVPHDRLQQSASSSQQLCDRRTTSSWTASRVTRATAHGGRSLIRSAPASIRGAMRRHDPGYRAG